HAMQRRLAKQVIREDRLPEKIRFVAGVDVAYARGISIGVATVLDYDSLALIESQVANVKTQFPYIPTLLSFREISPTFAAIKKLKTQPDVFLVDGQGIAHPYRLGFASHLGLIMDKPTIGVAKSRLCGKVKNMTGEGWAHLIDRGEIVGAAVMTKTGRKPLFVSVGHKVSLERAIKIVRHCTRASRIPEPILTAHKIANEEKTQYR
ncbi:MAG: deoxyribonuclease V, partial [Candidatus Bathyarchaeia archaeon]